MDTLDKNRIFPYRYRIPFALSLSLKRIWNNNEIMQRKITITVIRYGK